ncbi:hypothetical protein KI387_025767, partial [Taxus chinensis]
LFRGGVLFLGKPLDEESASLIMKSMVYLNQENRGETIMFFLHCRGGAMASGVALYDLMQYVTGQINTIGVGLNASMGAFVLHGGTRGKRAVSENGRVMIHQPFMSPYDSDKDKDNEEEDSTDFKFEDPGFEAFYLRYLRQYITSTYLETSKMDYFMIHKLMERDHFLDPDTAVSFGIVDQVGVVGLWPRLKKKSNDKDDKSSVKVKNGEYGKDDDDGKDGEDDNS